jgi:acyl-CoA dehydrogenase
MSELNDMVVESATRLFSDACTADLYDGLEGGDWPADLWRLATDTGLTSVIDTESDGGRCLPLDLLTALARAAGATAAPIPIVETLLGQFALNAAGLAVPEGPLAFGPVLATDALALERRGSDWLLTGGLHRIPWGRHVHAIVVVARCGASHATVCIPRPTPSSLGQNYAGEPRDSFLFDAWPLAATCVGEEGRGLDADTLYFHAALWRSAQMAGAMQTALDLSLRYSMEREQFGRPIGKFQAVQQQMAMMASQVAAGAAAVEAAVAAAADGQQAGLAVAATKARVSEAAGHVVAISHQVHGAMGFTREHALHRSTRRLMAWRDEFGSEAEWSAWIGRTVASVGGDQLWAFVTEARDFQSANLFRLDRHA